MSAGAVDVRERLALARAVLGGERDPFAAVWAGMSPGLRGRLLVAAGVSWLGVAGQWHEIPAPYRAEIKRRCVRLRDDLLRVFPLPDAGAADADAGAV